jgi:hypothetical protein
MTNFVAYVYGRFGVEEEYSPTDAWGEVLAMDLTEEQQTLYDDGWDCGYAEGYTQALIDSVAVVTALFASNGVEIEE